MSVATTAELLRFLRREAQAVIRNELQRSFSRFSNALHVVSGTGFPAYTHADAYRDNDDRTPVLSAELAAANAAPSAETDGLDASPFGAVRLHWRNAVGGTRTTIDLDVYALTRLGWVKLDGESRAGLGEAVEVRIASAGYRRLYVRATAIAGVAGNVTIYLGGEP